ncbi:hypothetical protein ACH4S9_46095 [Streptomyces sp. NPDC021225]|uniref:hypothetical protein n=1 Tax=Streptomyces sp. NPDC021225 TaxID=3365121 RepID=UPI0037AA81B6
MSNTEPAAENSGLVILPAEQVSETVKATLKIEEHDGTLIVRATEGTALPANLVIVDGDDTPIAIYSAAELPRPVALQGRTADIQVLTQTLDGFNDWLLTESGEPRQ